MEFGISPHYFMKRRPNESPISVYEAIDLVARHGFTALDLSSNVAPSDAEKLGQYVKDKNLRAHTSHLPFWRYKKNADYEEFAKLIMERAETARILGIDTIVAHCDEFDFDAEEYNLKRVSEFNYRLFYPIAEFAAKHGMKLAFENVFEDMDKPRHGSVTEDLLSFMDRFDSDHVGVCWDFGHAKKQYPDSYTKALDTAADKIICTHLHDNYYQKDLHSFPFLGDTDWEETMRVLGVHGFSAPLTLELVYGTIPTVLLDDYVEILYKSLKHLKSMM